MITAAIIGGPIASTSYVVALHMSGSFIIPISALSPMIGAILARILFKQKFNARMLLGFLICLLASSIIGITSVVENKLSEKLLAICFAFIAAFGWAFEGCIAGYGASMIDYEIEITIRQSVSGFLTITIFFPLFCFIFGENINFLTMIFTKTITNGSIMIWFIVSGFLASIAFSFWYKGNSMCGIALGAACNGAYSFWGPFFCWILLGLIAGREGWTLSSIAWVATIIMVFGILIISMNPLILIRNIRKKER